MSIKRRIQLNKNADARADAQRSDWYAQKAAARLRPINWGDPALGIRRQDTKVFSKVAEQFEHIILVRWTNPDSLTYVGKKGFAPKPIDLKPKTAKLDVYHQATGLQIKSKGLVVDPDLLGLSVYGDNSEKALEEWQKFLKHQTQIEKERHIFHRNQGKGFFAVDLYKASERYGCLMVSDQNVPSHRFSLAESSSLDFKLQHMSYIHADYDLYGLIDLEATQKVLRQSQGKDKYAKSRTIEQLIGAENRRTEKQKEIEAEVNRGIGVPMIQHGSQDIFEMKDDTIYVFYPNGSIFQMKETVDAIKDVYERVFNQEIWWET